MTHHYTSPIGYARMMDWYDAALAHIHVPVKAHTVPTRFGATHVLAAGCESAPPVVLLHGINTNAAVWVPQINGLAAQCRVFAPDVPGFAGKGSSQRPPYRGSALADWLADTLDALGVERALIVGGSAGGWFALKFAAYYPCRRAGVLVMNPCGITPYRHVYKLTRSQPAVTVAHWLRFLVANRWVARGVVQRGMTRGNAPTDQNLELAYLLLRYYTRRISPPLMPADELRRITSPVMLVVSEHEIYTNPHAVTTRLRCTLPNLADVVIVDDAGHDINKEKPDWVNQHIVRIAQSLSAQPLEPTPQQGG